MTAPSNAETFLTKLIDARVEAHLDARGIGNHRCVPTEAAYDAAVLALNKHRQRADVLADIVDVTATQAERATRHAAGESGMMFVLTTVAERLRAAHERDRMARQSLPKEAAELLREPLAAPAEGVWMAGITCPVCNEPPGTWCRSVGGNPVGWVHDERRDAYLAAERAPRVILDPLWIEIAADHIGERITDWPRHMLTAAARDALMRVLPLIVARATGGAPVTAERGWAPLSCGTCFGTGDHKGRDCGSCSIRAKRCPSCDHLVRFHGEQGCCHGVSVGTMGVDRVCPCSLSVESFAPEAVRADVSDAPFETVEMRAENGVFARVEVHGEHVAATGNGMALLSPWAAEVVGNAYLHAAREALLNGTSLDSLQRYREAQAAGLSDAEAREEGWPTVPRGGTPMPPIPAPPAVEGACPRCGGLEGNHIFRDCPEAPGAGRESLRRVQKAINAEDREATS